MHLTAIAFVVALAAWYLSPRLIAVGGLDDLELLGQACAVVLALSVMERVFALLPGAGDPAQL